MTNYTTAAKVGYRLHMTIGAATRPNTNEVAQFMNEATAMINAEALATSNMTDTFGVLAVLETNIVARMVNNMFAVADPEKYAYIDPELTPEEKRTIHMAQRRWTTLTWSVGD